MEKRCLLVILCATACWFSPQSARAEELKQEAAIQLSEYKFGDDIAKKNIIQVGTKVVFSINAYAQEFMGKKVINANATIVNLTATTMQSLYFITFYDMNDNVLGAYNTNWTLQPRETINYSSALIKLKDPADIERVAKYRVYTCTYEVAPKK